MLYEKGDWMEDTSKNEFIEKMCANSWKELYRFIYYKVQNREEAEDITQETYARAISNLERNNIKVIDDSSYLKAISMNIIRDQWRSRKRKGTRINIDEVNPEEFAEADFADTVNDRTMIEAAMESLTKDQQTVINWRIIKGYSVADTAKLWYAGVNPKVWIFSKSKLI